MPRQPKNSGAATVDCAEDFHLGWCGIILDTLGMYNRVLAVDFVMQESQMEEEEEDSDGDEDDEHDETTNGLFLIIEHKW